MKTNVECPKCSHQFNIESALSDSIRKEFLEKNQSEKNKFEAQLKQQNDLLEKERLALKKRSEDFEKKVEDAVKTQKESLRKELLIEVQNENSESLRALTVKLSEKTKAISDMRKEKLEFQQQVQELEQKKLDMDLEIQEKVLAQTSIIKEDTLRQEREKRDLVDKEKDMKMNQLKATIEDLQRKVEQGSQQSQGEVLELELERLLGNLYPQDEITEVKKGANGADCLHEIRNSSLKKVGMIAYETKRTKAFSETWISKLKEDMRNHKAHVGIIVTETMPCDMDSFGEKNGVWICKFSEVEGLSRVLRHSLLKLSEAKIATENSGEKMQILYNYLISEEFKQQMEAVVNGYTNLKGEIDKEKRSMKSIWKRREKQLELIIDGAIGMHGSIKAIAGNSIAQIDGLEFDDELLEE
jgi:hypothetical protein